MRGSFLPFHKPHISDNEIKAVVETLKSGWLTTGPGVKRFEGDFRSYIGSAHAVATSSGTAALHLALASVGIRPGDEVIVPTITFAASAEAILYVGARPVLMDCRRDTFNIDERALEERITPRTRAIMPVHMAGQPCEMETIASVAQEHQLKVIEDAAHALPAEARGKTVGTIGDITAFSFYATKTITTGEGGMATTENEDFAERMRILSLHGISKDAWKRYTAEGSWYYEVLDLGYKYNMTDIAAALGIQQLQQADEFHERRKRIAERYSEAFSPMTEVLPPGELSHNKHAWHLYIILLQLEALTIGRAQFIEELKDRNIGTSVHFIPLHLHPYYRDRLACQKGDFPDAEWVYDRCISLPIYPGMSDQDVTDVIDAVIDVVEKHRR